MQSILTGVFQQKMDALAAENRFFDMLTLAQQHLQEGFAAGRITENQLQTDLPFALVLAWAAINTGEYESYYYAIDCLENVRAAAFGEGVWYYRLTAAQIGTGQLEQALETATEGVAICPNYPWNWLNLGMLQAHFGLQTAALATLEQGRQKTDQPYEFIRTIAEVKQGASLEQMQGHALTETEDALLESDAEWQTQRRLATMCITTDTENLQRIQRQLNAFDWQYEEPYCFCMVEYGSEALSVRFDMNEAGVSKLSAQTVAEVLRSLPQWDALAQAKIAQKHPDILLILGQLVFERQGSVCLGYHVGACAEEQLYAYLRISENGVPEPEVLYQSFNQPAPNEAEEALAAAELLAYTPAQKAELTGHINRKFGAVALCLPDPAPQGVVVDIAVVAPSAACKNFTLVTMGMGALNAAELVMQLPSDWQLHSQDEQFAWPMDWLRRIGRSTLLGENPLADRLANNGRPLSPYTMQCGFLLCKMGQTTPVWGTEMPALPTVSFYAVHPVYHQEYAYAKAAGADALQTMLEQQGLLDSICLRQTRRNALSQQASQPTHIELRKTLRQLSMEEKFEEILQTLQALPAAKTDYRLAIWLGFAHNQLQQFAAASAVLNDIKQQGETDVSWLFQAGYACYYQHQYATATRHLSAAAALCPQDEDIRMFLGFAQLAAAMPVRLTPFAKRAASPNAPQPDWCTLPEALRPVLQAVWQGTSPKNLAPMPFDSYRQTPKRGYPRQDILAGATACLPLLQAYQPEDTAGMDTLQNMGCFVGFIQYSNGSIPRSSWVSMRAALESLLAQTAQNSALLLGGAVGTGHSYMDFLIFDLPSFLQTASEQLAPYHLRGLGFHLLRRDVSGVSL